MAWKENEETSDVERCDLCIIGAGMAGLNALFVAAQYLRRSDRVVLIDRKGGPGGMWTEVYDHCRLHQPHPSFTVGDLKWGWSKPADYLATGAEVEAHLRACFETIRDRVTLEEFFGHTVTACDEIVTEHGAAARVEYRPVDGTGPARAIEAKRVIRAIGYDVPVAKPMRFTSSRVVSTTPERLGRDLGPDGGAPVYIVGGGKTGMDTAHRLIGGRAARPVSMINGKGTVFASRDKFFPAGARRWWGGELVASSFREQALMFDGTNEDEAFRHYRATSTISLDGAGEGYDFGILSQDERDLVASGLDAVIADYLEDVADGPDGPEMVLKSGARRPVAEGSVFVACTGYLLRHHQRYTPYLSDHGAVLSISQRSMVHFLSSASAYYLTHLFLRGTLRDLPLYEFDGERVRTGSPRLYHTALMSLTFMNQLIMMDALPLKVFNSCGLDVDRHYPLHRRAMTLIDVMLNGRRHIAHCRRALDTVRERLDVRCGPLAPGGIHALPARDSDAAETRLRAAE